MSKLTVMVPARNEQEHISRCLRSLNRQTRKPDKIIVFNDGSTDRTAQIIEQHKQPNYLVIHHKRKPGDTSHSYHRALRLASQHLDRHVDYVGILDADTMIESRYYEKVLNYMTAHPNCGLCGGIIYGEDISPRLIGLPYQEYVLGANRVYTRELWRELNHGSMVLGEEYNLSVDTHHYLRGIILGYKPKMLLEAKSVSLRRRPPPRPYFRGYASYKLGYHAWYMLLRAFRNLSPKMLTGYAAAFINKEEKWPCAEFVRSLQVNRIKGLLGVAPKQREIPYELIRRYESVMLEYGRMLAHSKK